MSGLREGSRVQITRAVYDSRTGKNDYFYLAGIASHVTDHKFVVTYVSGQKEVINRADRHWRLKP